MVLRSRENAPGPRKMRQGKSDIMLMRSAQKVPNKFKKVIQNSKKFLKVPESSKKFLEIPKYVLKSSIFFLKVKKSSKKLNSSYVHSSLCVHIIFWLSKVFKSSKILHCFTQFQFHIRLTLGMK